MDAVAWWVEDDVVWFFLDIVNDFEDISGYKFTVIQTIEGCVFFCSLDSLFYDLDTDDFAGNRCNELCDRACSAIQVKYDFIV